MDWLTVLRDGGPFFLQAIFVLRIIYKMYYGKTGNFERRIIMFNEMIKKAADKLDKRCYRTIVVYVSYDKLKKALSYCDLIPCKYMDTCEVKGADNLAMIRLIVRNTSEINDTIRMLKKALKDYLKDDFRGTAESDGMDWGD